MLRIDTSAASNPDVLKPRISEPIADDEPGQEATVPAAAKCPECGFTMLIENGCTYCHPISTEET